MLVVMGAAQSITSLRKSEGRGKFLTTLLILNFLLPLYSILSLVYTLFFLHQVGNLWGQALLLINNIFEGTILIGLWQWRKQTVYAFFLYNGFFFLIFCTIFMFIFPYAYWGWIVFWPILVLGIWYLAIKRKWHLFT